MYIFYEENNNFFLGFVLSETDKGFQVQIENGKKNKVKHNNILVKFEDFPGSSFINDALKLSRNFDIDFIWQCLSKDQEFTAKELADNYFGESLKTIEYIAILFALQRSPIYFYRRGCGKYYPAPEDSLKASIISNEKKLKKKQQQEELINNLLNGKLPKEISDLSDSELLKLEKSSVIWQSLEKASLKSNISVDHLLLKLGFWSNSLTIHKSKFLNLCFPKNIELSKEIYPEINIDLPKNNSEIYSIDDISTTEIDDALSVEIINKKEIKVGIYIAVPGIFITPNSEIDKIIRERLSTVYMPGSKITMQPDPIIDFFSLDENKETPALSLYVTGNLETGEIIKSESLLEKIKVKKNLRNNNLDVEITEKSLDNLEKIPYENWFRPLWEFSKKLSQKREIKRGRPENQNRIEYSFHLDGNPEDPKTSVRIFKRPRNTPTDRMIAEYMILANTLWANLLAKNGLKGIYRSQQAGKTKMSLYALPHESIGADRYIWSTSPLRRYIDLVNQWQILDIIRYGVSARLATSFKDNTNLFLIINEFDKQYQSYIEFQNQMERYWCIRWLKQENIKYVNGQVLKNKIVRMCDLPINLKVKEMPNLEKGTEIKIELVNYDEISLEINAKFVEQAN